MNVTQLLAELAQQHIRLVNDDGRLKVKAPKGALTPKLREHLSTYKNEVLALLDIASGPDAGLPTVKPDKAARYEPFPLTDIQQAYWVGRMAEFSQGDVSIHLYTEVDLSHFDARALESSWAKVVGRHDMLRSSVLADGTQQIMQDAPSYQFRIADLRHRDAEAIAQHLDGWREELSHQVLSVESWPPFDMRVSRLPGGVDRLHVSIDLVNMDGGSVMLLLDEWATRYLTPQRTFEVLELSYRDYALAEHRQKQTASYAKSLDYWRERVALLPPAPVLPRGRTGGDGKTRFLHLTRKIAQTRFERLRERAGQFDVTVSAVLATAFSEVLARWAGSDHFTLNVTLFSRLPIHEQVERIVGDFTSMVLLEVDRRGTTTFLERARKLQKQLWQDLEHCQVSGVRVLRELARARGEFGGALMPIVFTNMLNLSSKGFPSLYDALERMGEINYLVTQTPQVWLDYQLHQDEDGVRITWDAISGMFPESMLDAMLDAQAALLDQLADSNAAWTAGRFDAPWEEAAQLKRQAINATEIPVPAVTLHELFRAQVAERKSSVAVVSGDRRVSYSELEAQACALGERLRDLGIKPDDIVAIALQKGWKQVVATLAVHFAGGAYLPLDVASPPDRLKFLIEHSGTRVLLSESGVPCGSFVGEKLTCVDLDQVLEPGALDVAAPSTVQGPGNLAYLIYTSGSSGTPKGVMIEQRSVVNRFVDVNRRAKVGPRDRILALTPLHHDLAVYDIFGVLAAGAAVVMPEPEDLREPDRWVQLIQQEEVTLWNSVPTFLSMLVEYLEANGRERCLPSLRFVILAGDWIPVSLPDRLRRFAPNASVVASGGPTETTIWDVWYEVGVVDPGWRSIPYGKPMANARYYVLDEALRPCPDWVGGELYIGGMGLARGYWRDEARTREAFVTLPDTDERVYRSGDMGRMLPDGNIEFLGRRDHQVQVGGVRIELGEVDAQLHRCKGVKAAVTVYDGKPGEPGNLVAYVVREKPEQPSLAAPSDDAGGAALADLEFKAAQHGVRRDLGDRRTVPLERGPDLGQFHEIVNGRVTSRTFGSDHVNVEQLGGFLSAMSCNLEGLLPSYRYPSAGSTYAVQTYLAVKPGRVEGVDAGYYYYDPAAHRLIEVNRDARLEASAHDPKNRAAWETAAFSLVWVAEYKAIEPLYGTLSRDFCLLETGYAAQLLMLLAAPLGLGLCPIGGFDSDELRSDLGLGTSQEVLHSCMVGPLAGGALGQGRVLQEQDLRAFLEGQLPASHIPSRFVWVDALPLNANGKIDRSRLRELGAEADVPSALPEAIGGGGLVATIQQAVAQVLGVPAVDPAKRFFDLGATSLHVVRIVSLLRSQTGKTLSVRDVFANPTARELAAFLEGKNLLSSQDAEGSKRGAGRRSARARQRPRRNDGSRRSE